jgi:hypothetical protein
MELLDSLRLALIRMKKKEKILNFDYNFNLPISKSEIKLALPTEMIALYTEDGNGFSFKWKPKKKDISGGVMEFMSMEDMLQDWKKSGLFTDDDVLENDLLEYYKPFDLLTETFSCGLLITPQYIGQSIYCHNAPYPQMYNLDIDFAGYLEMAKESLIFPYWPKVLLDIQTNEESYETQYFKEEMPKLKDDFKWENFITKYESLRLSKRDKE